MKKIDLNNYEAFLLDYSEGTLSGQEITALKAFIIDHPGLGLNLEDMQLPALITEATTFDHKDELRDLVTDEILNYIENTLPPLHRAAFEKRVAEDQGLANELESYKKTILSAGSDTFEHKAALIKTADDLILNNREIAYAEGQLSAPEKTKFEQDLIGNPLLQKELALVLKTKLMADASVVYPGKAALKKENKVIALFSFRQVVAVAAAILLLFGLVVVFNNINTRPAGQKEYAHRQKAAALKPAENRQITTHQSTTAVPGSGTTNTIITPAANIKDHTGLSAGQTTLPQETIAQQQQNGQASDIETHDISNQPVTPVATKVISGTQMVKNDPDTAAAINITGLAGQGYLTVIETAGDDDDENGIVARPKNSFWKRAVHVARQANKLGVKSVDGVEKPGNSFHLSFNSFSVEKK